MTSQCYLLSRSGVSGSELPLLVTSSFHKLTFRESHGLHMSLLPVHVHQASVPRLRGDALRLQKGKKKTSVVVDAVTTSVETVGRSWWRKSGGRRCLRQYTRRTRRRRRSRSASVQPAAGGHPRGARNTGALMVTLSDVTYRDCPV